LISPLFQHRADKALLWIIAALDERWTIPTESSTASTYCRIAGIAGVASGL
jgi:hypothetical protein